MAGVVLAAVAEVMSRPWAWGEADCCTAACDVFHLLHGVDPMASLRGAYADRAGAVRMIRERGGFSAMAQGMADAAGLAAGVGAPGEIGAGRSGGRWSLVVCIAPGQWAGKTMSGFATLTDVRGMWRA